MKSIASIIITISLLLAMNMCTLQVNAYHLGRGLRPVVNNNRNKDGKAQDKLDTDWQKAVKNQYADLAKKFRAYQSHEQQQQQQHKLIIQTKLKEMNLLELISVPGITNPSLLETSSSLSPSACQFSLLENLNRDLRLNCGDYRLNMKKYNNCRGPKLSDKASDIASKCCRTCTQCSGCEGLDYPDADVYEKDSPGHWHSKRTDEDNDLKTDKNGKKKVDIFAEEKKGTNSNEEKKESDDGKK
jgi:hypothetical protein